MISKFYSQKKLNKFDLTVITLNKQAYHNFFIIEEFEAGVVLQGWEVKSLRAGKVTINNSYVIIENKEAFLLGTNFAPLRFSSINHLCNSVRTRKLLLNQNELNFLYNSIKREGFTIIALSLFWKGIWCKVKLGVAKGKKYHDKRLELKEREWQLDKTRLTKINILSTLGCN